MSRGERHPACSAVGGRNAESRGTPRHTLASSHSLSLAGIVNNCSIPGESIQVARADRQRGGSAAVSAVAAAKWELTRGPQLAAVAATAAAVLSSTGGERDTRGRERIGGEGEERGTETPGGRIGQKLTVPSTLHVNAK